MAKNASISLGDHFEGFIIQQIESGRYSSQRSRASKFCGCLRNMSEKSQRCAKH